MPLTDMACILCWLCTMFTNSYTGYPPRYPRFDPMCFRTDSNTLPIMRKTLLAAALALPLLTLGCVGQQKVDDLQDQNRALNSEVARLQTELNRALEDKKLMEEQLQKRLNQEDVNKMTAEELKLKIGDLQQRLAAREAEIQSLRKDMADLIRQGPIVVFSDSVSADTNDALQKLADENPDLMTYDPERGMIRLKSDITFRSGSHDVNDKAKQALGKLGRILSNGELAVYGLRVVGHTDNQPLVRTKGKYGDNLGLSSQRAVSVCRTLRDTGVSENRMEAVGVGQHQPLVPNNNGKGTAENRRVEIFIIAPITNEPQQDAAPAKSEPAPKPKKKPAGSDTSQFK